MVPEASWIGLSFVEKSDQRVHQATHPAAPEGGRHLDIAEPVDLVPSQP